MFSIYDQNLFQNVKFFLSTEGVPVLRCISYTNLHLRNHNTIKANKCSIVGTTIQGEDLHLLFIDRKTPSRGSNMNLHVISELWEEIHEIGKAKREKNQ
jgi:hypothetical protein